MDMIHNLADLYREVVEDDPNGKDDKQLAKRIANRRFKSTDCGVSFQAGGGYVLVNGYCEGTDAECQSIRLSYPFTTTEFWNACEKAEEDGYALWNQTHGCEKCWPHGYCTDFKELEFPGWPVNPECKHCGGKGTII